jgi:hypothetical protein
MELKDFISETIKQITDGILEGNSYVKEKSNSSEGIRDQYTKIDIGGKITVVQVFNAGASSSTASTTTNQNRIKFEILAAINTR